MPNLNLEQLDVRTKMEAFRSYGTTLESIHCATTFFASGGKGQCWTFSPYAAVTSHPQTRSTGYRRTGFLTTGKLLLNKVRQHRRSVLDSEPKVTSSGKHTWFHRVDPRWKCFGSPMSLGLHRAAWHQYLSHLIWIIADHIWLVFSEQMRGPS